MESLQSYLFKFLNTTKILLYVQLLCLSANYVKASQACCNAASENPPLWPEPQFASNNPFADIIEKITNLKKTAKEIKDGDIENDKSLLQYKSYQYPFLLKKNASETFELCLSLLADNNKIITENLEKVLDAEQFFIEAEAFEPNPLTSYFVFKNRHMSTQLFNMYLKEKGLRLIELPERIHGFDVNQLESNVNKIAGPIHERIDIVRDDIIAKLLNTNMADMCKMQ
ncbi:hypothetical protein EDEG_01360 [Edhazardia aedis USNM 41457]|uniref:Uncharacterized protein n=1 Tax=Edhazardia aedis (strain USNM 41457) TaxID=1003232 RepID=J9D9E1_EDHAE|nr:hypothetical protein EDEG_01360 [Edhazardia aedis USNM 41457]|eukprot:EJW04396.1 hypothetical protein EDEG_01360 [Edhazardia aedis USNM 41457]